MSLNVIVNYANGRMYEFKADNMINADYEMEVIGKAYAAEHDAEYRTQPKRLVRGKDGKVLLTFSLALENVQHTIITKRDVLECTIEPDCPDVLVFNLHDYRWQYWFEEPLSRPEVIDLLKFLQKWSE